MSSLSTRFAAVAGGTTGRTRRVAALQLCLAGLANGATALAFALLVVTHDESIVTVAVAIDVFGGNIALRHGSLIGTVAETLPLLVLGLSVVSVAQLFAAVRSWGGESWSHAVLTAVLGLPNPASFGSSLAAIGLYYLSRHTFSTPGQSPSSNE